ncbi:MAG TPA: NADH-quinone oxidoreductase subunit N [Terriglobales bacterium]|jgi:NADH-quinone oxidoreductase subunit N|nr:NADH-quinone oxidoreductase subunit N [Terriglobales bacterium]
MIARADYIRILPEIVLTLFGLIVMFVDPLLPENRNVKPLGIISLVGALSAVAASIYQMRYPGPAFWNFVVVDNFSIFFHLLVTIAAALVIMASFEYLRVQEIRAGEYFGLILFGTVGMALMSSAVELVLIFIALEISSISTYILAGFRRRDAGSVESSLKYFLLGSFATAFFLYGIALMFGATGSTDIPQIATNLRLNGAPVMAYVAFALIFVGLGFKIASAPFHVWTPDVYEGAPSPVVAFMSTAPKMAVFAVLLRILFVTEGPTLLAGSHPVWFWWVWASAAVSMTLGNLGALVQTNVKRMLAYSAIAHAGYLLVAFAAAPEAGISAAMFYAASYTAMNLGAFIVVSHFANAGERYVTLDDYTGLGRRSPLLAMTLTIFLISLIGIPATAGFFAKFYVFSAALKADLVWLTIIAVVNSAIGAYYYLRVIVVMYMRDPTQEIPVMRIPAGVTATLLCSVAAVIYLGILPGRVLEFATRSAQALLR